MGVIMATLKISGILFWVILKLKIYVNGLQMSNDLIDYTKFGI